MRDPQNVNALVTGRLGAQLGAETVRGRRKRFFGGALSLPASPAAPMNTLVAQRLFLQSEQVAAELGLGNTVAGPGTIQ